MELHDAEQLAIRLMKEFGLASTWRFEFDNAKSRFGCCHRSQNLISLSRILTEKNVQAEVEDTIRHEIAHALCPPREGHGEVWKAMCRRVGARPVRCYSSKVVDAPEGDWRATCGVCGKIHYKFRRPTRELWCADKECKRMSVPYVPGADRRLHPARKLVWRHKDAIEVVVSPDAKRAAVEAMKAQLRREQEMEQMKEQIADLEKKLGKN
jgi:predicted SprT family Zn-dependent metalloprotease